MDLSNESPDTALAPRPWVQQRLADWLADPASRPGMLVRGDPGSGKSSVLLQLTETLPEEDVVARISRAPGQADPFDSVVLLRSIIEGLNKLGIHRVEGSPAPTPIEVSVNMDVDQAPTGTTMIGAVMNFNSPDGLLPIAERLIRAVPPEHRVVIVVDALDQAEDEDAGEFLAAAGSVLRAAQGSGVRLVCASRRELPIGFDYSLAVSFDLISDAPEATQDLSHYLEGRFKALDPEDRERVVAEILKGAESNWLWASTNADSLEADIAEHGGVPPKMSLTAGLEGLYGDGVQRIRRRIGSDWVPCGRPVLTAVASAFDEHLTLTELRWITDKSLVQLNDVASACEPFLRRTEAGIRMFHPDFARWILAGNVDGASEEVGHLAVARGFTEFGRDTRWGEEAANAASRVIDHWCAVLVLDPFSPSFREYEEEMGSVLADSDWTRRANIGLDAIEQVALVAPTLRFPHSSLPLATGLRVMNRSIGVQMLVAHEVLSGFSDDKLDEFNAITDTPALALRWLEDEIPEYARAGMRVLWGTVLKGQVSFTRSDGELLAYLSPDVILSSLDDLTSADMGLLITILKEIPDEHFEALIESVGAAAASAPEGSLERSLRYSLLGDVFRERAGRESDEAERTAGCRLAMGAYRLALAETPKVAEERLTFVIDCANTLRRIADRTEDEIEELIAVQNELTELRRKNDDENWPFSSNLLGDAYRDRARQRGDKLGSDEAQRDLRLALAAYREAREATPRDGERRLSFVIDCSNTLRDLHQLSDDEIDELTAVQGELLEDRRSAGSSGWPVSSKLLGDAYRDRSARHEDDDLREKDLRLALSAYRDAFATTPPDGENWLNFAIDTANALTALGQRSDRELDELVSLQKELFTRRRQSDDALWPQAAALLVDVYLERADRRKANSSARAADLSQALAVARETVAGVEPDGEWYSDSLIKAANVLFSLDHRSDDELDELIGIQGEIVAIRREQEKDAWPLAARLLARVQREKAQRRDEGDPVRAEELGMALKLGREAHVASKEIGDDQFGCLVEVIRALEALDRRSSAENDELVTMRELLVDLMKEEGNSDWILAANLLGDAYRERAEDLDDPKERAEGLDRALTVYRTALAGCPQDASPRPTLAQDVASMLMALDRRSDDELNELIELLEELLVFSRAAGSSNWPVTSNHLGDAYSERADRLQDQKQRAEDRARAVIAYRMALVGTASDSAYGADLLSALAYALMDLEWRTDAELNELVDVLRELLARQDKDDDPARWGQIASRLGSAYFERAEAHEDDPEAAEKDLVQALAMRREALAAIGESDEEHRLGRLIDVANTLIAMGRRSDRELEELIEVQSEVLAARREAGDKLWPQAANLLGDAYRLRARQREDDAARAEDLAKALEVCQEAFDGASEDDDGYLGFAIDLANTMVIWAAVTRRGDARMLTEATTLVAEAAGSSRQSSEMTRLLPVLRSALRRRDRWREQGSRSNRSNVRITVEPITLAVLGAEGLRQGIQFLYAQAGELLKRRRERQENERVEATVAISPGAPTDLAGERDVLDVDFAALDRMEPDIRALRDALADYATGVEVIRPEESRAELEKKVDGLRCAVEAVVGQRITFQGEDRSDRPGVEVDIDVDEVSGYVGGVVADYLDGLNVRASIKAGKVDGTVIGVQSAHGQPKPPSPRETDRRPEPPS